MYYIILIQYCSQLTSRWSYYLKGNKPKSVQGMVFYWVFIFCALFQIFADFVCNYKNAFKSLRQLTHDTTSPVVHMQLLRPTTNVQLVLYSLSGSLSERWRGSLKSQWFPESTSPGRRRACREDVFKIQRGNRYD